MTSDHSLHLDSTHIALPEGYTQRPATMDDAAIVGQLYTAAFQARGHDEIVTEELTRTDWSVPNWDLATSSQLIFNPQGQLVGTIAVSEERNPTRPWMDWEVAPDEPQWQVVVRALIAWGEQRAQQAMTRCAPEERFAVSTGCDVILSEHVGLLESLGYQAVRYFYRMAVTLTEAPVALTMPEGIVMTTFDPAQLEEMVAAKDEIWRDHYGYVPRPLADVVAYWKHLIESDEKFDPSMWYIARSAATGEIAGLVLARLEDYTKADQGYILVVGVRRAYRKHGLAQAMLLHAFADYWQRGQKTIVLGVDASNPTGAARLYERVGMAPVQRYVTMEKEVRSGVERMNTGES